MSVSMDKGVNPIIQHDLFNTILICIHDKTWLFLFQIFTLRSKIKRKFLPLINGKPKKVVLPIGIPGLAAKLLVGRVISAQEVAMGEQDRGAIKHHPGGVIKEMTTALLGKVIADEKITVSR